MNIVFAESVQSYGGAQIATLELAARLQRSGHSVTIVDSHGCCAPYCQAVKDFGLSFEVLVPRAEPYVIGKYRSRIRNAFRLVGYLPLWRKLKQAMRAQLTHLQPDAVVCYNHKVLSLIDKSPAYQTVYYAHGWYVPQQMGRVMRSLIRRRADKILAVSQATRMALYAGEIAPLDRIFVVHNAIEPDQLAKEVAVVPKGEGKFTVLMCGGFLPDKGQHIAVEVLRELCVRGVDVCLVLTGIIYHGSVSETYYKSVLALIDRYDLSDRVEVVLGKPNVIDYFRACDCLIHPSATEGLPLVVIEAMALGKPVVVNAVGGITDLVLDGFTGFIAPHNDVVSYADAVARLATDSALRAALSKRAGELINNTFNTQVQIDQFLRALAK